MLALARQRHKALLLIAGGGRVGVGVSVATRLLRLGKCLSVLKASGGEVSAKGPAQGDAYSAEINVASLMIIWASDGITRAARE